MDLLTLLNDLILLITKSLPDTEERLALLKLRSPKIYANIQRRILNSLVRYCKNKNFDKSVCLEYVDVELADLPDSEIKLFQDLVLKELKIS